jgi:hypothetical protein
MPANSIESNDTVHYHHRQIEQEVGPHNTIAQLSHKWKYDISMEQFLRRLPKVGYFISLLLFFFFYAFFFYASWIL